ncbi:fimbrial protein [[Enterobacter] lignolyticus]|uniref:Adhesin MrkD (Involved in the expression of type III fimbriae) n=1 Tax=Enterobacter lignolyticus (strain SCF1) TaxID=701347 RepID=E3GA57_ENTLS|nr:fimbrial protein [[Enterobacter] lignolyticus]ADO46504.1 putative adhesin MrkD (involved in the expression of type III fimbriae) [[Enterobacter] lignolyticus SCF1]
MKKRVPIFRILVLWAAILFLPSAARASCTLSGITNAGDAQTALIPFGKINLTDTYLQPVGTLLASIVVPPTNYTTNSATASSVLWTCDATDLPNIYFLVATNGDDRVGGYYDLGATDGITGAYATWFGYTGLKLTMSGVTLTRYWQKVPVTTYATSGSKIQIRLQDVPPLLAELYRVSTLPGTSAGSSYCGNNNTNGNGIGLASTTGRNYTCTQPNAYIQLSGSSSVSFSFGHDAIGADSNTSYNFWGANNGFGYGMRTANTLYQTATCVARNATPVVMFPTASAPQLMAGGSVNASFSVQVECSNTAVSGTSTNQTAIGFQVSSGAFSAAQTLGLVNASGGVTMLVSDNYGTTNMAAGVGITLQNSLGTSMIFVGQPGTVSLTTAGGNAAGWYPVLDGASPTGSVTSGYTQYQQLYTATLKRIAGQTVTPGKVYATAYVLVKMQ